MYMYILVHDHYHILLLIYANQVCGVKGPTVLALHHCFDLVGGVVIDDLHGIYLGVTLSLLRLWFDRINRGKPFFIGDKVCNANLFLLYNVIYMAFLQINQCDQRLLSIKVTDKMSRVPKSLKEFSNWKGMYCTCTLCCVACFESAIYACIPAGAELRNWLLFFSLPVLREILPSPYLSHFALVVSAVYMFSTDNISQQSLLTGRCLLKQFHREFSGLYGIFHFFVLHNLYSSLLQVSRQHQ